LHIPPEKVGVTAIPSSIESDVLLRRQPDSEVFDVLTRFNIRRPYALYAGSTTNIHKNHARLLLAWAQLKRRLGNACPMLICTAKGHRWGELKTLIKALHLEDTVVFTDTVETPLLVSLMQNCAFQIVPTLYEGGGSGPVVDACIVGNPVLCSNIPPIIEHLTFLGGGYAEYFDPNSVLSIVDAVLSALPRLPDLSQRAQINQTRILSNLPSTWHEWTSFYTNSIQKTAETNS
jgi:glycosyltransferase involved in cell wall biosynthesis